MDILAILVMMAVKVITWIMFIYVIMSWLLNFNILNLHHDVVRKIWDGVRYLADLLCDPIRRVLPSVSGIDFSPMVVIILAILAEDFVVRNLLTM